MRLIHLQRIRPSLSQILNQRADHRSGICRQPCPQSGRSRSADYVHRIYARRDGLSRIFPRILFDTARRSSARSKRRLKRNSNVSPVRSPISGPAFSMRSIAMPPPAFACPEAEEASRKISKQSGKVSTPISPPRTARSISWSNFGERDHRKMPPIFATKRNCRRPTTRGPS